MLINHDFVVAVIIWATGWVRLQPAEGMRLSFDDVAVPEWVEGRRAPANNDDETFDPALDDEVIRDPFEI